MPTQHPRRHRRAKVPGPPELLPGCPTRSSTCRRTPGSKPSANSATTCSGGLDPGTGTGREPPAAPSIDCDGALGRRARVSAPTSNSRVAARSRKGGGFGIPPVSPRPQGARMSCRRRRHRARESGRALVSPAARAGVGPHCPARGGTRLRRPCRGRAPPTSFLTSVRPAPARWSSSRPRRRRPHRLGLPSTFDELSDQPKRPEVVGHQLLVVDLDAELRLQERHHVEEAEGSR